MRRRWLSLGTVLVVACGSSAKPAEAPASGEAEEGAELASGTPVCFGEVLPMRYVLEDALDQHELASTDSCTAAELRIEEVGDPGKYLLRYQRLGDDGWKECESDSQDRAAFLQVCVAQRVADMGSAPSGAER